MEDVFRRFDKLHEQMEKEFKNRPKPRTFTEAANLIQSTVFFREIDVVETDAHELKLAICNLLRSWDVDREDVPEYLGDLP